MLLSLCLAVYNEEKFIHYPLDSCIDFVDEVIIVDGGSTDKTIEIAKKYGSKVKVIKTDNPPMFHINKQKAIEAARGEWILQLDADETLSEDLKQEIKAVISQSQLNQFNQSKQKNTDSTEYRFNRFNEFVAYWIPRKNFFLSRFLTKGGVYPDYTIRLYKNGKAHFPCKTVHENVEVNGEIGYLKNPLLHYADPNFSRYLARWNRYTMLDAKLIIKENKKINFFDYLILKPNLWFFKTYFRHLGFVDGFPGFVFAFFSAIRFWGIYFKVCKMKRVK